VKQLVSFSSSDNKNNKDTIIRAGIHSQNRTDNFKQYNNSRTVQLVNIDYNKPETIANALGNVDKLFLLTLPTPNVTAFYSSLVNQIKKYGKSVNHIVKLSSLAAENELETATVTTIGRIHRQEEQIIEESGIPYTFLRPGSFMQNFVNYFGHTIKSQNAFFLPAGDGEVSFVDARDVAAVSVRALTTNDNNQRHIGKAYPITGQEAISYGQAAEILSKEGGRRISYVDIPEQDARKAMKENGMYDWLIDTIMEFYSIIKAGRASKTTNVFEQVVGRNPISFNQFAKDYAEFFR
jgi:uncharacterized protein YbjT (DUF2867 family)